MGVGQATLKTHLRLRYATACWCRRTAVMRRQRDLSHACTQTVARTCATLALEDFRPPRRTDIPDLPHVCDSSRTHVPALVPLLHAMTSTPSPADRPDRPTSVPVAEPKCATGRAGSWGSPSPVNRPLLTEAWVALVRRWRWLAGEAGDPAGKIHGARTRTSAKSLPALPWASAGKIQWGPPCSKSCHDTKFPVRGN